MRYSVQNSIICILAELIPNHIGFFFLSGLGKQCNAILLVGLLMDKAIVKTSQLGILEGFVQV